LFEVVFTLILGI